ncbi:MAG: aminotransferase class I/II-fold pyridoxal phosphate-dependent enzyme [Williamsia sp.]|nr:aminotransferase class I/II-fold pyridoxal phosphate-dependent enzyme [Williamsia sp.]
MPVHSKLPDAGTTIFTVMSSLAAELGAINLGQGFPDFQMNEELISLVSKAMYDGFNQYVHMNGWARLREVLAEKIGFLYHTPIHPESQITVTPGGTYAIYTALTAVLQPGDEVIVFQPCYDSYIPNILVNGAVPVLVDLQFPEYKIDWAQVRSKITPRTRMIMINSPHNPTGSVLSKEDIEELTALVKDTDILILSDEVYEHLIYDGLPHQSILRYPGLLARSFVCFSFGKIYNCTGWKLGYCVSSPELMAEFRKIHQFNCFSCHAPSQVALSQFLLQKDSYLGLSPFMQAKRDLFGSLMQQTRFTPLPSRGSYFQVYRYDQISDEDEKTFSLRLIREAGVAVIPVSALYQSATDNKVVRFCFAKKEETLERAVEKLVAAGF